VLRALGRDTELAQSSLRLSLGRFTTTAEVDRAAAAIRREVSRLRVLAGGAAIPGAPSGPPIEDAEAGTLFTQGLSPLTRRYFRAPARVPRFPQGVAPGGVRQGSAGLESSGTAVRFEFELSDSADRRDRFVKSARFSAYGCPHTLAVTAWLCEVVEGARFDAGPPGTPADWAAKFDVPTEKLGRLLTVEDALRAAFYP
jgi:hypothetical protein